MPFLGVNTTRVGPRGSGGATSNPDFISTWDTTKAGSASNTVVLPLVSGGTYNGKINWGDGNTDSLSYANRTHVYASSGIYTITLSGTMVGFRFINTGDKAKILDISNWGELNPTTNRGFMGCSNLDVSATDAPIITANNLDYMFYNCSSLTTADFSKWDTSTVTSAQATFQNCVNFNGQLDNWVHSGVTSLHTFFFNADRFAGNLDSWDTSGVTNWYETFRGANFFNASMAGWVIRGNMHSSFLCNSNNTLQGLGMDTWDVSQMTRFGAYNCSSLNPDVSNWDTSSLLIAQGCWQSCSSFNRNMANWDINQVTNFTNFMLGSSLSTANYDATLIAWDAQGSMAFSGTVNFGSSKYSCRAEAARTSLISKWGGITDGGLNTSINCNFVSTWDTTQAGSASDTIVLPMAAGNTVDWGDGSSDTTNTHTYASGGTYTVTIEGSVTGFRFNNGGDKLKIIEVSNCGGLVLDNTSMFYGTSNLDTWSATDAPTITTTNFTNMFRASGDITPDWSNWDVSGVTIMKGLLRGGGAGSNPNPNISNWVTTSLTQTAELAINNTNFNQNLNGWSFGLVNNVTRMFNNADAYDQPMGDWDVTSVTNGFNLFMISSTGLSPANYGTTLIGWAAQLPITYSGIIDMGGSTYDSGDAAVVAARNAIISSVGGITDGGAA